LSLDGRDTNYLMIFERRILRKTFGPVRETYGWKMRTNYKLNKLLEGDNKVRFIKAQRLK